MNVNNEEKIKELKEKLTKYEDKLAFETKTYRGVIHESAVSEVKHSTVMVLRDIVYNLKMEIAKLEES